MFKRFVLLILIAFAVRTAATVASHRWAKPPLLLYGFLVAVLALGFPLGVFRATIELELALLCTLVLLVSTIAHRGILTRGWLLVEFMWLRWGCATACRIVQGERETA